MNPVISLPERLYKRLRFHSQQVKRTPEEIVISLLQRYLAEPDDHWQAGFQALLARVQAKTAAFSPDEIENDITLAAAEVKEMRRAHRHV